MASYCEECLSPVPPYRGFCGGECWDAWHAARRPLIEKWDAWRVTMYPLDTGRFLEYEDIKGGQGNLTIDGMDAAQWVEEITQD